MYKCNNCRELFDTPNYISERVGECHGSPAYERWPICPNCGSEEFSVACDCEICGEAFTESELTEGICPDCFYAYRFNILKLYELLGDYADRRMLNPVFSIIPTEKIEELLLAYLKSLDEQTKLDCLAIIENNKYAVAEKLLQIFEEEKEC